MWCTQRIPTSSVNQIHPPGPLHEQGPTAITPQLTLEMYSFPSSSRRKHSALSQAPGSGFQVVEMGRQRPVASSRQLSGWSGTRHCPLIQCTRRWSNFCRSYRLFSEMTNLPSVLWWVHGVRIHWSTFYVVYFHQYNKMLFLLNNCLITKIMFFSSNFYCCSERLCEGIAPKEKTIAATGLWPSTMNYLSMNELNNGRSESSGQKFS